MVSFRAASDQTHITQLLGRMVRTPLARRIPGNERLNSVDCLLPKFNKDAVKAVVEALMSGGDGSGNLPGRRVLINPREMTPNPNIADGVWDKLTTLPSAALPKKQARPIKRLTALAHELSADGLLANAGKLAHSHLHTVLDAETQARAADISKARAEILTVGGISFQTDIEAKKMTFDDFVEVADYAVIEDAYKRAGRLISPDLAKTYSEHVAEQNADADDFEEALMEAHTDVAALGLIEDVKTKLEAEAEKLANNWLTTHADAIKDFTDERKDVYRELRELSAQPLDVSLAVPRSRLQATTELREDGSEAALPLFESHLLCDEVGKFPNQFDSSWERKVLDAELALANAVAWYRNPSTPKPESLGIIYKEDQEARILRPDFIFFTEDEEGEIHASIVDPHGHHLAESLPKLKGLRDYAAKYGAEFSRIEAIAEIDGTLRSLDMQNSKVREAIDDGSSAKAFFAGALSTTYPAKA